MEIESLEDEECSGQLLEVDNAQLRATVEADPLSITQEVADECNTDHSMVTWLLKQIGKVKKFNKWMPHELTANQKKKKIIALILILCNNNEPLLDRIVMWDKVDFL